MTLRQAPERPWAMIYDRDWYYQVNNLAPALVADSELSYIFSYALSEIEELGISQNGVSMKQWFTSMLFAAWQSLCAPGWNQVPPLTPVKHPRSPRLRRHRRSGARIFYHGVDQVRRFQEAEDGDEVDAKLVTDVHAADNVTFPRDRR